MEASSSSTTSTAAAAMWNDVNATSESNADDNGVLCTVHIFIFGRIFHADDTTYYYYFLHDNNDGCLYTNDAHRHVSGFILSPSRLLFPPIFSDIYRYLTHTHTQHTGNTETVYCVFVRWNEEEIVLWKTFSFSVPPTTTTTTTGKKSKTNVFWMFTSITNTSTHTHPISLIPCSCTYEYDVNGFEQRKRRRRRHFGIICENMDLRISLEKTKWMRHWHWHWD